MLENKRPFCWEQYNIYIDAWKQKTLCVENNTIFTQYQDCPRLGDFPLLLWLLQESSLTHTWSTLVENYLKQSITYKDNILGVMYVDAMHLLVLFFKPGQSLNQPLLWSGPYSTREIQKYGSNGLPVFLLKYGKIWILWWSYSESFLNQNKICIWSVFS